MKHRGMQVVALIAAVLLWSAPTRAADPVAVLTELHPRDGQIGVKRAGGADWSAPQPLSALYPGDQIRVTGNGRAVIAFTGGSGAQTVVPSNSPFTVQAPRGETGTEKARALAASVTQFLLGQQKEPAYQILSVRGQPPRILSPRDTRVLPGPITFEWTGSDFTRYRVQVAGPDGLQLEQANLRRQPFQYPASAPSLRAGTRYTWTVEATGHPIQRAQLDVVATADADRVRAALGELTPAALPAYPQSTLVLMRASLLVQEGLYHDARRELMTAMATEPDEPSLRLLLGQIYHRTGLPELAAQEFEEARILSSGKP